MTLDLSDQIEQDLRWREAELASLKVLVVESDRGSVREATLLRAIWALLYAHYEGFFKFAWDLYLDHLENSRIPRNLCRREIAELSLTKEFNRLRGNLSSSSLWTFCQEELPQLLTNTASFEIKLDTRSNLWPQVIRENSAQAGLRCATVESNDAKLKALVRRRNEIAHGQKMIVRNLGEYQDYEDIALVAMHELAVEVLQAIETKNYLNSAIQSQADSTP